MNGKPYTVYKVEKLRKRKRRRLILASLALLVVIVLAVGGGYYWWFTTLGNELPDPTSTTVTTGPGVEPPDSMDILVLGCDKHPDNQGEESRSDTVMLVHVDKEKDYVSILSLPRDLYVEIPNHGMNKLNAAYSLGGWELTEATVEQVTGMNIEKVVEIDFKAFSDLTDALGGVYLDIDRRYYNQAADSSWETISISPGYQLLNGADALDYVRFRHDNESDFGRMLRQQRFINSLRAQAVGWNLVSEGDDAIKALLQNMYTNLSSNEILRLAWWGIRLDGAQIKQVSLIGDIVSREIGSSKASVVVATDDQIAETVDKILSPPEAAGGTSTASAGTTGTSGGSVSTTSAEIDRSDFTTDLNAIENSALWKQYAHAVGFQLMAPGWLPDDYRYTDMNPYKNPGSYDILDSNGNVKGAAVKVVYHLIRDEDHPDDLPQYLGLMETTWLDAPAAGEGTQKQYNGTTYTIVGTNQRTDHVWWVNNGVLYWVSNTLSYYLSAKELLKVAESMMVVPAGAVN